MDGIDGVEFTLAFIEGGMEIVAIDTDASSLSLSFSIIPSWFENDNNAHSVNSFLKS